MPLGLCQFHEWSDMLVANGVTSLSSQLTDRVVEAYGGEARWRQATAVETRISMGGLLLRLKGHPPSSLHNMRARTEIARPYVRVEPIDSDGNIGVLDGHDVRIERPDGTLVAEQRNVRSKLPYSGRRWFRWHRLDALYFIGYTQWTYNSFPALLWRDDIAWSEVGENALEARFSPELPTHSPVQRFHFDPTTGLLRQMDYTAEVFGSFAKAAHVVEEHGEWEGIPYPSRRRVWSRKPDGSARTSPAPLMILLDVHEWRLV
jgi:hypothetical protein